ncbi:MAG TPA: hypothetical protein PKJ37_05725 [Acidobacteriota bacterium]|nr:hypothetical protein [Acidobacteriota bacterium]HNT17378.1 hypothetical protein [Acidobacteriota bacterium]
MKKLLLIASFAAMLLGAVPVFSQELDPLLQLLIEKKVLTQDEAQSVQKEYNKKKTTQKEETKKCVEEAAKSCKAPSADWLSGLKIGGTYFISYQNGNSFDASQEDGSKAYNKFVLKRGYLDVKKDITPWMGVRFTPDVTLESSGDYKLRMKFLYADFHWKGNSYFSQPHLEVGMIHFPWFDLEESVNLYRMQDSQFLDRVGMAGTADLGAMFGVNFGEPLPKEYQDTVSKAYPGKWGSFELGVYNGGGYTANEKNTNKVIAGRVSVRPVPSHLPGLQFHIFGVNGKGNVADNTRYATAGEFFDEEIYPEWNLWAGMITYQHEWFNLSAEYFEGDGNAAGTRYYTPSDYIPGLVDHDDIFKGYAQKGYSFFGEAKLGDAKKWSLMARYDKYDPDTKDILDVQDNRDIQKRYIYGVAYKLYKNNVILLDYQKLSHSIDYKLDEKIPDENRWQLTLQIKF